MQEVTWRDSTSVSSGESVSSEDVQTGEGSPRVKRKYPDYRGMTAEQIQRKVEQQAFDEKMQSWSVEFRNVISQMIQEKEVSFPELFGAKAGDILVNEEDKRNEYYKHFIRTCLAMWMDSANEEKGKVLLGFLQRVGSELGDEIRFPNEDYNLWEGLSSMDYVRKAKVWAQIVKYMGTRREYFGEEMVGDLERKLTEKSKCLIC